MALSPEELEALRKHLEAFRGSEVCSVCKNNTWEVQGPLVMFPISHEGVELTSGPTIPLVILCCNRCFNVRTFAWAGIAKKVFGPGWRMSGAGGPAR